MRKYAEDAGSAKRSGQAICTVVLKSCKSYLSRATAAWRVSGRGNYQLHLKLQSSISCCCHVSFCHLLAGLAHRDFLAAGEQGSTKGTKSTRREHLLTNLGDLFLSNKISAERAQELFRDAALSGAAHVEDLSKGLDNSNSSSLGRNGNAARDLQRKLPKSELFYWASIPIWNPKNQREARIDLPMLLPHETVAAMLEEVGKEKLIDRTGMCAQSLGHLQAVERSFLAPGALGLGLWVDGTPYSLDKVLSLESVVLSMPRLGEPNKGLCLPIAVIPQHFCFKQEAMQEIFQVISWSIQHLALGCYPATCHNGQPFPEAKRSAKAGSFLTLQAFLVELRGDWAMRKELKSFPAWRDRKAICHLCDLLRSKCSWIGFTRWTSVSHVTFWAIWQSFFISSKMTPICLGAIKT